MADDVPSDRGHLDASATVAEERERSVLEALLRPLTADACLIADRLLRENGSLAGALAACGDAVSDDPAIQHLRAIHHALRCAARGALLREPILPTSALAAEYLMIEMAHLTVEHLRVLFLNTQNRLIADETVMRGTIDSAPAYPREIIRRAIELGAASIILAHNHPSGDPTPSKQDIAITRQLADGGATLNIAMLDHLILSSSGWTSLRAEGLM